LTRPSTSFSLRGDAAIESKKGDRSQAEEDLPRRLIAVN
jgi:hypothetical protein